MPVISGENLFLSQIAKLVSSLLHNTTSTVALNHLLQGISSIMQEPSDQALSHVKTIECECVHG